MGTRPERVVVVGAGFGGLTCAKALGRAGVLPAAEAELLTQGLEKIRAMAVEPGFLDRHEFAATEDVHSFIESRLASWYCLPCALAKGTSIY